MKNQIKMFLSSGKTIPQLIKKSLKKIDKNEDYIDSVLRYDIWSNSFEQSIPIYQIYHHVHKFVDECEIKDNKAVSPDGKIRKVLFLGYDGMRVDMAAALLTRKNEFDDSLDCVNASFSGIKEVCRKGGIYLAYCGGETGTKTQQTTSTSAGWTAQFTGVWGTENGIKTNEDTKNMMHETFMLEYAEKGLASSLNFTWDPLFDVNYAPEVRQAMKRTDIKMDFCDTDRKKGASISKALKISQEFSDFLAPEAPSKSAPFDSAARDYVLHCINRGDDIVCGLYDSIDAMGHMFEFSPNCAEYANAAMTCDTFTYQILQEIDRREAEMNEEWLVILANDHGGIRKGHGGQTLQERTTWIATNKPIDETLFGKGYDGKTERK